MEHVTVLLVLATHFGVVLTECDKFGFVLEKSTFILFLCYILIIFNQLLFYLKVVWFDQKFVPLVCLGFFLVLP